MSEITGTIDALESRIGMLIRKIDGLQTQNSELKSNISALDSEKQKYIDEISKLTASYQTLKLTNSLLGGEESKRDTKLKINSMIRDIDYCISQLEE